MTSGFCAGAHAGDKSLEMLDDALENAAASIDALDAERNEQAGVHQFLLIALLGRGDRIGRGAHGDYLSLWTISMVAFSLRMRSLLTIRAAP